MVGLLVQGLEVVMSFYFFILAGFAFRGSELRARSRVWSPSSGVESLNPRWGLGHSSPKKGLKFPVHQLVISR